MMTPNTELYFDEPLFAMHSFARFIVRLVSYSFYGLLVAFMAIALLSDVARIFVFGLLIALFLVDRAIRVQRAERDFAHIPSGKVNVAEFLSLSSAQILEYAFRHAHALQADIYLLILERLLVRADVLEVLRRLDITASDFQAKFEDNFARTTDKTPFLLSEATAAFKELLVEAFHIGIASQSFFIEPRDLFAALAAMKGSSTEKLFLLFNVSAVDVRHAVLFSIAAPQFLRWRRIARSLTAFVRGPHRVRARAMNRAWTARPTPTLDAYSEDITAFAQEESVGFLIGHNVEYERMVDVLARPTHPNVLLVGDPGVGKESLVAHCAYEMMKDRVPEPLFDKRLVSLRLSGLLAGADPAELRSRVERIIQEIIMAGNVILYIPDIHNLVKTSGAATVSVADLLIPAMMGDAFSVIGSTYPREFQQYIETQTDFAASFDAIRVAEVSEDEATRILIYQSLRFEREYGVFVTFGGVRKAVQLAHQYFRGKPLPGSAEELLKEVFSDVAARGDDVLSHEDVIAIAQRKINVPLQRAEGIEAEKLLNLESVIHQKLVDQEEAVVAVSRALREYRSGLSRKEGPIATFLFVGPTGVGKTELSKILTALQFGSKEAMVRFDMSEFQEKVSLVRFIGSSDGAVSGMLTDVIREKPYSLVLLDEFEKSHPDILNLFLQVFDDGRLTDALGRTVDFTHTIIIATSNAHSTFIKESIDAGKAMPDIAAELKKKLVDFFRPELLNRFSGIIVFKTLTQEHIVQIAKFNLKEVVDTVRSAQGIELTFDDLAIAEIARLGYDPAFGARPLRGVISEKVRGVLAEKILRNEVARGATIRLTFVNGQFEFINI